MKIGLQALGIGNGARPDIIRAVAQAAESAGFGRLWAGEHIVLFDRLDSRYPYAENGVLPVGGMTDWLDPFITLSCAATVTSSIRLATGICLVPEHNPLHLAKQAASLDRISRGRFALGAGIGWMAEEFAALGVPFERRAQRTREYIAAMRCLWSDEIATFAGDFVKFDRVMSFPKPFNGSRIPVLIGGESHGALARAAAYGDGWYGFNLDPGAAAAKIGTLRQMLATAGRAPGTFEIVIAPFQKKTGRDELKAYRAAGVSEIVAVASPPGDESAVNCWIGELARQWMQAA